VRSQTAVRMAAGKPAFTASPHLHAEGVSLNESSLFEYPKSNALDIPMLIQVSYPLLEAI